jgi:hypothetical protein
MDGFVSWPAEYSAKLSSSALVSSDSPARQPLPSCLRTNDALLRSGPVTLTPPSPRQLSNVKTLFRPKMNSSPGAFPPPPVLHGTRVPLVLGTQTALLVLALLFYGLRIYSRARPALNFMWDDFFITLAMVSVKGKHLQSFVTLTLIALRVRHFRHKLQSHIRGIWPPHGINPAYQADFNRQIQFYIRGHACLECDLLQDQRRMHASSSPARQRGMDLDHVNRNVDSDYCLYCIYMS